MLSGSTRAPFIGYGDELMAAGEAQRLYDEVFLKVAITDRHGNPRWSDVWAGNPAIATPEDVLSGASVQYIQNGLNCRPYNAAVPFTVQSGIKFTKWRARDHRGKLYLTDAELAAGMKIRARQGPYWLIEPTPKARSNPNKQWPYARFLELVRMPKSWEWVQGIHPDSIPLEGVRTVATPSFRAACGLLASAEGYVGTEGGLHHAAASLGVPAVVIFGGCMSVDVLGYPEHVNLADDGPESPCGRWTPCLHCRDAMARIEVFQVWEPIRHIVARQRMLESSA